VSNYYFTSARILNSTTAQPAKMEAIHEFPGASLFKPAVAALPTTDSIEHFQSSRRCSHGPAGREKEAPRWTGRSPVATASLNRSNDGLVEMGVLQIA